MYLLFIFIFLKLITTDIVTPIPEPQEIPVVSASQHTCPCSLAKANLCRGGIYVDYYYNAPYSGYPRDAAYLPPVDSVPVIIEKLTLIRDTVKEFISGANAKKSDAKKALYVKDHFSNVKYLLHAVHVAARKANATETVLTN